MNLPLVFYENDVYNFIDSKTIFVMIFLSLLLTFIDIFKKIMVYIMKFSIFYEFYRLFTKGLILAWNLL